MQGKDREKKENTAQQETKQEEKKEGNIKASQADTEKKESNSDKKAQSGNTEGLDIEKMSQEEIKILTQALIFENTEMEKQNKELEAENERLKKLADKAGQLSAMYSETAKDFEAYRKRNADIEVSSRDKAIVQLGLKIIPVYENLKRAADAMQGNNEGVLLIYKQFSEILKSMEITEFGAEGDVFDPFKHNAITAAETGDAALKGKIKQVYSPGYSYKDKIIKQSQVIVYK